MLELTPYEIGYLAAFLDADGSVSIMIDTRKKVTARPMLQYYSTHRDTMQWIAKKLGLKCLMRKPTGLMKRPQYRAVTSHRKKVREILEVLLPYMITKRRHGEIALKMIDALESKDETQIQRYCIEINSLQLKGKQRV